MHAQGRTIVSNMAPGIPTLLTLVDTTMVPIFSLISPAPAEFGNQRAIVTRIVGLNEGGAAVTLELYSGSTPNPTAQLAFLGLPTGRINQAIDVLYRGNQGVVPHVRLSGATTARVQVYYVLDAAR